MKPYCIQLAPPRMYARNSAAAPFGATLLFPTHKNFLTGRRLQQPPFPFFPASRRKTIRWFIDHLQPFGAQRHFVSVTQTCEADSRAEPVV
jgi:hypothetical protein